MIIDKLSEDSFLIKDLFSHQDIDDITSEFFSGYNPYMMKRETTATEVDPRWMALHKVGEHQGDNMRLLSYAPRITVAIKKAIKPPFPIKLARCNTNLQFKYQDSTFHHDGFVEERDGISHQIWSWTFLLFAQLDWNTQWGGEFCYQDMEGNYKYVPYIPGSCVLFNGWLQHKGNAPNTMASSIRSTVAWTYTSEDCSVDWRYPNI